MNVRSLNQDQRCRAIKIFFFCVCEHLRVREREKAKERRVDEQNNTGKGPELRYNLTE